MERILGTPCNKLGVNVFSFSPPLTSVPRSLFRGLLSFSSHFKTSLDILGARENVGRPHGDFKWIFLDASLARILQNPDKPIQTQSRPLLDENYKYVDISTFQKTHNQELGGEILVFLCWLRVGNYSLCLHQRPICGLQAADGEGGLCYYNFTKLLQLLEAVLRLFVRAQDELRAV